LFAPNLSSNAKSTKSCSEGVKKPSSARARMRLETRRTLLL
jgi:hypothetical protein